MYLSGCMITVTGMRYAVIFQIECPQPRHFRSRESWSQQMGFGGKAGTPNRTASIGVVNSAQSCAVPANWLQLVGGWGRWGNYTQ